MVKNVAIEASKLVNKTDYDAKIKKRIKIPNIANLPNPAALNGIGNKIPNVSNIVKKQIMMLRSMKLMVKYPTLMI